MRSSMSWDKAIEIVAKHLEAEDLTGEALTLTPHLRAEVLVEKLKSADGPETYIFTFGPDHKDPTTGESLRGKYVEVPGTYHQARDRVISWFGSNWAFQYDDLDKATRGGKFALERIDLP
jgi:hypothetical protein